MVLRTSLTNSGKEWAVGESHQGAVGAIEVTREWTIQNLGQWEGTVVPYLHRYWFPLEPSVWYMDEVLSCSGRSGVPMDLAVSQHAMFEIRLLRV